MSLNVRFFNVAEGSMHATKAMKNTLNHVDRTIMSPSTLLIGTRCWCS